MTNFFAEKMGSDILPEIGFKIKKVGCITEEVQVTKTNHGLTHENTKIGIEHLMLTSH